METTDASSSPVAKALGSLTEQVRRRRSTHPSPSRLAVTVLVDPASAGEGGWPAELAALGDKVEITTRPAPGDRGTEIRVRVRDGGSDDPELAQEVRIALRRTKQVLETGGVLTLDPHPAGHRTTSVRGTLLDLADAVAGREGVL